jgi:hypothetical protein
MIAPPPCLTPHWGPHTAVVGLLAAVVVVVLSARTSPKSHPLYIYNVWQATPGDKERFLRDGEKDKEYLFHGIDIKFTQ